MELSPQYDFLPPYFQLVHDVHCLEFFIQSVNALPVCISMNLEVRDYICAVIFVWYLIELEFNLAINKFPWMVMISENIK